MTLTTAVTRPPERPPGPQTVAARAPANPWVLFAVRRSAQLVLSLFVLISAAWLIVQLIPGDPVRGALGLTAPQSQVLEQRHALGLDQPLVVQYGHFLQGVFTADLGTSLTSRVPVASVIGSRLPATLQIALLSFVVTMLVAVPVGMAAGVLTRAGRRPRSELAFSGVTGVFAAVPEFLLGVGLVAVFAVWLAVLPVAGRGGPTSYVLPVVSLALGPTVVLARIVRVETVRVLQEDYMRTARAKRLPPWLQYLRHALPNLLTATLTVGGLVLGALIAGTVLVENVFAWPGMGTSLVQSITAKDYPLVQGYALVYGAAVLLVNLAVDVLIALVDPRSTIREA